MQDKRKYPRLALGVYVDCEIMGSIDPIITTVPSKDISPAGIRVVLFDKFNVGTLLKLKFLLPGYDSLITATGQVVWTDTIAGDDVNLRKTYDAGIKFIYIDLPDSKKISEYIGKRT